MFKKIKNIKISINKEKIKEVTENLGYFFLTLLFIFWIISVALFLWITTVIGAFFIISLFIGFLFLFLIGSFIYFGVKWTIEFIKEELDCDCE